jgi:hypothetical protein
VVVSNRGGYRVNRRRLRWFAALRLVGLLSLVVFPGCTTTESVGDVLAEGLSNTLGNLVEAGLLTFLL